MTTNQARFNRVTQWLQQRQSRVLDNAHAAAREIRVLEEHYYKGKPIVYTPDQNKTVYDYVRSLCDRRLLQVRTNLTQFRINSFLLSQPLDATSEAEENTVAQDQTVINKLNFIESVISKYRPSPEDELAQAATIMAEVNRHLHQGNGSPKTAEKSPEAIVAEVVDPVLIEAESARKRRGLSFWRGSFLRRKLDPEYERQVLQQLRLQQKQNQVAARWLAILILIPLLVGLMSRYFVFEPILGHYSAQHPEQIELNAEIREEFAVGLNQFQERLEVQELLGLIPEMTPEVKREQMAEKAIELWQEAREAQLNGLKNLFSDLMSVGTFAGLVYFNRNRLRILSSATHRAFLSLNDPVKVFLFILVTDMFVGFHSAEGWSVILHGIGRHFGLPENEAVVGLFIATVPVALDSYIKFWIFTYLTRFSPASSAVYERMNT